MLKTGIYFIVVLLGISLSSCSEYNKILKGSDYELKYKTALELYEEQDCYRALPLFEELMTYYRMTEKGEDVYYYYSKTQYSLKEFYLASYYFKRFTKNFPNSPRKEECAFMSAICTMKNSPAYNLDPTDTRKAIDDFQLFMDQYPESSKIDTCNLLVAELRGKLERKSYEQGKLYFKMSKYKSATIAFQNTLQSFPDTHYREELMYLAIKANYLLAQNSIPTKKEERFEQTIESYHIFADYFSESDYMKSAENYFRLGTKALEKLKK